MPIVVGLLVSLSDHHPLLLLFLSTIPSLTHPNPSTYLSPPLPPSSLCPPPPSLPGNDLYHEMIEGGVIKVDKATGKPIPGSKAALVYGQMNEPPGARARVALTGNDYCRIFPSNSQLPSHLTTYSYPTYLSLTPDHDTLPLHLPSLSLCLYHDTMTVIVTGC